MSIPFTLIILPFTSRTSSTDKPIGLGLIGEQVLKTPVGSLLVGGVCISFSGEKGGDL